MAHVVLLCSGVSALLVVALEGVRDTAQLQMVEFGRGFGYKLPLSISMPSVGSTVLKQIVSLMLQHVESGEEVQLLKLFHAGA